MHIIKYISYTYFPKPVSIRVIKWISDAYLQKRFIKRTLNVSL